MLNTILDHPSNVWVASILMLVVIVWGTIYLASLFDDLGMFLTVALLVTVFSMGTPLIAVIGGPIMVVSYFVERNKEVAYRNRQEEIRISRLNPLKVKSCEFEIFFATGCILDKKSTYEIHQLNRASKELLK